MSGTDKFSSAEDEAPVIPEKSRTPSLEAHQDVVSTIDPEFMREISTIMEESSGYSQSSRSHLSQPMSMETTTQSRQSNPLSVSSRSNSTVILPSPFPNHNRNVSESNSVFGPTRLNSALGPWRDSLWSTTATPTGLMPPSSAYASPRQSRRSLSLSARVSQAQLSGSWYQDQLPRGSGRLQERSFILPPLPTPGFGNSTADDSSKNQ